jgi:hypothetical protein
MMMPLDYSILLLLGKKSKGEKEEEEDDGETKRMRDELISRQHGSHSNPGTQRWQTLFEKNKEE